MLNWKSDISVADPDPVFLRVIRLFMTGSADPVKMGPDPSHWFYHPYKAMQIFKVYLFVEIHVW